MVHLGARPIRFAWSGVVFPSLLLNYAGQAALVLGGAPTNANIFYQLCPSTLLIPMVVLATLATIIASQSIITGAFSMTQQAIQLGWWRRFQIGQTSAEGYGQLYVPVVNWLLMTATVALTVVFAKSDNLASAYGIAVSATMLMTSALLFIAMREILRWNLLAAAALAGAFIIVDTAFLLANLTKIAEGGYVPLLLAACVYFVMLVWHTGATAVDARLHDAIIPIEKFMEKVEQDRIARVPGTAVFLTRTQRGAPPVMVWHVKHNRALHRRLFVPGVRTRAVPWVGDAGRSAFEDVAPNFCRACAAYGFMVPPDAPRLLKIARQGPCRIAQ